MTIQKATLTAIGANVAKTYGTENPALPYNISGFINGDNIQAVDTLPITSTNAILQSNVGDYVVSVTGAVDNNYIFVFVNGNLKISKATQKIEIANEKARVRIGEKITLTASATSRLALAIKVSDTLIVSRNGLAFTGLKEGSVKITLHQEGDSNYFPADSVYVTMTSTGVGGVSTSILAVTGPSLVVPGQSYTYRMTEKPGFKYLWKYTGKGINWGIRPEDTLAYRVQVIFPDSVKGYIKGYIFDDFGNLLKLDSIQIKSNPNPLALLAAQLAEQLTPLKCTPVVTDCRNSYIVEFNYGKRTVEKTTCSSSGYGDYTTVGRIDTLIMGNGYNFRVSGRNTAGIAAFYGIWIDYANDGEYGVEDFVAASLKADSAFDVRNYTIKNDDSYKGPRRVRISMQTTAVTSQGSCQGEGIVGETEDYLIIIREPDPLVAPQFISPDGDGFNDVFEIRGITLLKSNKKDPETRSLVVFDRVGKIVYQNSLYDNTWDGKDTKGNKITDGTYFYRFTNGEKELKGFIEVR